ncbi:MAG: phosphoglucosamine mutase [Enterobacteriaceae bacterium]
MKVNFGYYSLRGLNNYYPINISGMFNIGVIIGNIFCKNKKNIKVLIGKDTRISCKYIQCSIIAGLNYSGVSYIRLIGIAPTPIISFFTYIRKEFDLGIMISASHNQYNYNGLKIFSNLIKDPMKIVKKEIFKYKNKNIPPYKGGNIKISNFSNKKKRYLDFCKKTVNNIDLNNIKIAVDYANGSSCKLVPNLLKDLGAKVISIGCNPNGRNINFKCGSVNIEYLKSVVLKNKVNLGIAYDGDGDRIIMVDHLGNIINGDQIAYILVKDRIKNNSFSGGVVGTVMSNTGLKLALKKLNIPFVRTQVGDSYILKKMKEKNWSVGEESSGHIILSDIAPTGDGIIVGLQILNCMVRNNSSLNYLCKDIKLMPQLIKNIYCVNVKDKVFNNLKRTVEKIKLKIKGGRIFLHKSSTEPYIRVMVEGKIFSQVFYFIDYLTKKIKLMIN